MEIRNFGANLAFQPRDYFTPRSEQEVVEILSECRGRRIRVVGRLHSWSEAIRSDDVLINLRYLDSVVVENRDNESWAVIGAGCQIKKIVAELDRGGRTLPSLGLITEQSIAGAISTGTHGSGKNSLSHYVDEVTVAGYDSQTGEPTLRKITDGPELRAARCSLGCLGVIVSVGLRCRDQYHVEEHSRLYESCDTALEAEEEFPLQQFFLVPFLWKCLAQHRREVKRKRSFLAPLYGIYWFLFIDLALHVILLTTTRVLRFRWLQRLLYRWIVPSAIPRGLKVVDRSHRILTMEHELFRHIEIEVFVPRSNVSAALAFVQQMLKYTSGADDAIPEKTWSRLETLDLATRLRALSRRYTHHYPICVRKVLPDDTLISMASGDDEPYYALSFISYEHPRRRQAFFAFAEVLEAITHHLFAARPHWGKVCPVDAARAAAAYPNLEEFRRVCDAFDPTGAFRNPWLEAVVFANPTEVSPSPSGPT